MKFSTWCMVWLGLGFALAGTGALAQVSPEIQLATRGVVSFNVDRAANTTASAVNDFSDTAVLLGFKQKLYGRYRGQLVVGFQFPDADSDLGQVFYHQIFVQLEDKSNILKIGRSRVRSALIEFPTLRDDDAIFYTDVLNPFSSGENTEDHQYGNVFEYAHVFGQRLWLRLHGEHFTKTPVPPATAETDFSLNAIGASLQYRVPVSQRWNRPILNQIGVGINNFLTNRPAYGGYDQMLRNVTFSTILNIRPDPVHFWDLRYQSIFNRGISGVNRITDYASMTLARSIASIASLRYLYRKLERPTAQVSLTVGYKSFPDLQQNTFQWIGVLNAFYRLGDNFDVGVQYTLQQFNGDLHNLFGDSESRIQFSLVFAIDQLWNDQFDDRDSLLNLEHGYIN